MTTTTKTKTEIQQAAICRCTCKSTKEVFYVVKSDSSDTWYQVRWNGNTWMCNCRATKPCKHMRAVNEVLAVRRSRIAAQMGGDTEAIVATMQAEEDKKYVGEQAEKSTMVSVQIGNVTISEPISNLGNAVAHHIWAKRLLAGVQEDPARKAEREARLQAEADEMIAEAGRKYDAPLNTSNQGFSLLRR